MAEFTELQQLADGRSGFIPMLHGNRNKTQTIAIGPSSAASEAFDASTTVIWLTIDQDCRFEIGDAPVATSQSTLLKAELLQIPILVKPGEKLALIEA